jgi:hypothetical protein
MKWSLAVALLLIPAWAMGQERAQTTTQTAAKADSKDAADREKNFQAYVALMRADVRNKKTEVMSAVLQLDAEDAAAFWPIYRDFETELTGIYDQVGSAIRTYAKQYRSMTDATADQLATKVLDLEQQRNDLKRRYYTRFKTSLDPIVAARFLQVENQIERVIDLQIAAELPIVTRSQQ